MVTEPVVLDVTLPIRSIAAFEARRAMRTNLHEIDPEDLDLLELLTSELVGNNAQHAGLSPSDQMRLQVRAQDDWIRVELSDRVGGSSRASRSRSRPRMNLDGVCSSPIGRPIGGELAIGPTAGGCGSSCVSRHRRALVDRGCRRCQHRRAGGESARNGSSGGLRHLDLIDGGGVTCAATTFRRSTGISSTLTTATYCARAGHALCCSSATRPAKDIIGWYLSGAVGSAR